MTKKERIYNFFVLLSVVTMQEGDMPFGKIHCQGKMEPDQCSECSTFREWMLKICGLQKEDIRSYLALNPERCFFDNQKGEKYIKQNKILAFDLRLLLVLFCIPGV